MCNNQKRVTVVKSQLFGDRGVECGCYFVCVMCKENQSSLHKCTNVNIDVQNALVFLH